MCVTITLNLTSAFSSLLFFVRNSNLSAYPTGGAAYTTFPNLHHQALSMPVQQKEGTRELILTGKFIGIIIITA